MNRFEWPNLCITSTPSRLIVKISLTPELARSLFIPLRNLSVLSIEKLGSSSLSGAIVSVEA